MQIPGESYRGLTGNDSLYYGLSPRNYWRRGGGGGGGRGKGCLNLPTPIPFTPVSFTFFIVVPSCFFHFHCELTRNLSKFSQFLPVATTLEIPRPALCSFAPPPPLFSRAPALLSIPRIYFAFLLHLTRASFKCSRDWLEMVSFLQNERYNKYLINLVFSVRTVKYGSSFFPIDLWPARFSLGP